MTNDELDEVIAEFLVESHENLDSLDQALLALEQDPGDIAILGAIFRSIHTIKGASGFLGFERLTSLTHEAESLLSGLRDGTLVLASESTSALFATVDAVRAMLRNIDANGTDGEDDYRALCDELVLLQHGSASDPTAPMIATGAVQEAASDQDPDPIKAFVAPTPEDFVHPDQTSGGPPPSLPGTGPDSSNHPAEDIRHEQRDATDELGTQEPRVTASASTIRVGVGLLDKLMNLVGELVLARNQILQCMGQQSDTTFGATAQRLNLITTELQENVMKTRMQPIGTIWSKFPRVVRDLSLSCGKSIRLELDGADTELDRTLIEAITDPLTHLVRNAVDHGLEAPEARVANGKAAEGRLSLRAYHEGGHVNIEISDDGAGIDVERVREKAIAKGLLRAGAEAHPAERDVLSFIFSPGFSTAQAVTDISGRGVGLDVVKTNIERIGGTVDVSTERGIGTTFRVKIPLTLAIIPALIVTTGEERFAIPQVSLVELVRLKDEHSSVGVEYVHGVPVHRLRGNLLPLVDLSGALGMSEDGHGGLARDGIINVVVLQAMDHQFGLIVDEICDTEEIVVKPLGPLFNQVDTFAGATIMGDGRVALILDVMGLAHHAGVIADRAERMAEKSAESTDPEASQRNQVLLVVGVGTDRRMAVHLSAVHRLEEFAISDTEQAGGGEVVQYRDSILPLIRLEEVLDGFSAPTAPSERLQVVVHEDGDDTVGLVVNQIIDIVEERVELHHARHCPGLLGSAVIQGRVTEVVDVPALVSAALRSPHHGADGRAA